MTGPDEGGFHRGVVLGERGMVWADPDGLDPRRIIGERWRPLGEPYLQFYRTMLQRCTLVLERAMPDESPGEEMWALVRRAATRSGTPVDAFARFVSAWSVMSVRLWAAMRHGRRFEREFHDVLERQSRTPRKGVPDMRLERHVLAQWRRLDAPLFDTVTNAYSALEAYGFSVYIAASLARPTAFPTASSRDIRQISLESTYRALSSPNGYPTTRLTRHLKVFLRSEPYDRLKGSRNALLHRGMPIGWLGERADGEPVYLLDRYGDGDNPITIPAGGAILIAEATRAALEQLVAETAQWASTVLPTR